MKLASLDFDFTTTHTEEEVEPNNLMQLLAIALVHLQHGTKEQAESALQAAIRLAAECVDKIG